MPDSCFDDLNRFVISNFSNRCPFASFLPGIAGPMGIPLWIFYVNRGQAIASFGIGSKDNPIVEFQPANKAYQMTNFTGFRTFIKVGNKYYEPFAPGSVSSMAIGFNELELEETTAELQINVVYFTLTNEPLAGLVRKVTLTNTSDTFVNLEVLDGLPVVVPYGVNNWFMKEMARTAEAWMEVFNLEEGIPFYRVRASLADTVEIQGYTAGHFYMAFTDQEPLSPIVDPETIFGSDTSFSHPTRFIAQPLDELYNAPQVSVGKTPCGFFGTSQVLPPGGSLTLYAVIGHASDVAVVNQECQRIGNPAFIETQRLKAQDLVRTLTDTVALKTSSPLLDAYTRQSFLDNVMRGGWPVLLGNSAVYHMYSRKHGDLERDYNAFYLAPEFYSQGNGNYRDVNQNRREDVWFNPGIEEFNVIAFMNLIQTDGYNPLVIQGSRFFVPSDKRASLLALVEDPDLLDSVLSRPFTPGELLHMITVQRIKLYVSLDEFLAQVVGQAEQRFEATFGEGYWIDHWTYNLDLIENYLAIYPERQHELLFEKQIFTFYDSPAVVRPRDEKYVLSNGRVRLLRAVREDEDKEALIKSRTDQPHVMRLDYGRGQIYCTSLFVKLVCLALNKFATLDPFGMGIEMEAGKPGWYDALNGLPGLLGSSLPETFELARLLSFIRSAMPSDGQIELPAEVYEFMQAVMAALYELSDDYLYWDAVTTAKEAYRAQTRPGFSGESHTESLTQLDHDLAQIQDKVQQGIERALSLNDGVPPTYFSWDAEDYDVLDGQAVHINRFKPTVLPLFLEGPVRALKMMDRDQGQHLYQQVKNSPLFDTSLKMYKVNASLESQLPDIGRARAFTPGWLENESIWLHMEYKYLYSMLKAGLYDEFYEDFQNVLVPFQNPDVYGRSPLENSSFIVSSAHPDPLLHGRGFVARLSGSTIEYLSILHAILIGDSPFYMQADELYLAFKPALAGWLFDETDTISFTFLGKIAVTYHNPQRQDTFGPNVVLPYQYTLTATSGETIILIGNAIPAPYAEQVRQGAVTAIRVEFK